MVSKAVNYGYKQEVVEEASQRRQQRGVGAVPSYSPEGSEATETLVPQCLTIQVAHGPVTLGMKMKILLFRDGGRETYKGES